MRNNQNLPDMIEWEAYEYLHTDRTVDWFWGVGLIGVALGIIAILMGNVLFAILIIVGTAASVLVSIRRPQLQRYALTPRGVIEGDMLYPYSELDVFWIVEEPTAKLLVRSKKTLAPLISMPLPETSDTQIVHDYLYQFIDDEPLHESSLQKLMEYFGF